MVQVQNPAAPHTKLLTDLSLDCSCGQIDACPPNSLSANHEPVLGCHISVI